MKTEELKEMTIQELTDLYNENAEKPVKKFRSKKDAIKKIKSVIEVRGAGRTSNLLNSEPAEEIDPPREGSKRDELLKLLRKSAKLETIQKHFDWTRANAMEALRFLVKKHGYGLSTNDNGTIRVIE